MPYEYKIDYCRITKPEVDGMLSDASLTEWLNDNNKAYDWRFIQLLSDVKHPSGFNYARAVFEREIAINQKLRQAQLEGDSLWKNEKLKSNG